MNTPGLLPAPRMSRGFRFVVMDVMRTDADHVIELDAPEELHDLAALLRDVVESVWSRERGEQAVAVATSRLHDIAGDRPGAPAPRAAARILRPGK